MIEQLIQQIKDELVNDLGRYDGDYQSWREVVADCPSNTLKGLCNQLISLVGIEQFEQLMEDEIDEFIYSLDPDLE